MTVAGRVAPVIPLAGRAIVPCIRIRQQVQCPRFHAIRQEFTGLLFHRPLGIVLQHECQDTRDMRGCHGGARVFLVGVVTACHSGADFVARGTEVDAWAKTGEVRALLVGVGCTDCDGIIDVCRAPCVCIHTGVACRHHHGHTCCLGCSNCLVLRIPRGIVIALRRPGAAKRHGDDSRAVGVPLALHTNSIVHAHDHRRGRATAITVQHAHGHDSGALCHAHEAARRSTCTVRTVARAIGHATGDDTAGAACGARKAALTHLVAPA
mmetsp:Transcript_31280/g.89751  ORF Transcript_31280/g.89751 Transcript_31280/m.89751 type:complete len:266 (-) Transcript_31280:979-1776(-)